MTDDEARKHIENRFPHGDDTGDMYKAIIVMLEGATAHLECVIAIVKIWKEPI